MLCTVACRMCSNAEGHPLKMEQVHVFWDFDNKAAVHTPPAKLVECIHAALQPIGRVAGICAYGNAATFAWVPPFERQRRRALAEG